MSGSNVKGKIGVQDLNIGTGTFPRRTSTGGVETLGRIGAHKIPAGYGTANVAFSPGDDAPFSLADAVDSWFDVRAYGADPTGVADSTAAIQAAVNAAAGAGVVYIPRGTWKAQIVVGNGARIVGDGPYATTLTYPSGTIISSSLVGSTGSTYGISIEGMTIDGDETATTGIEIGARSASDICWENRFRNLRVNDCQNGIIINGSVYSSITDVRILNTVTTTGYGLKFDYQTQSCFLHNVQTRGYKYNWYIKGTGIHAVQCANYTESGDTWTTNLLLMENAARCVFDSVTFEHLDDSAISEVLLIGNDATADTVLNVFRNCHWNGLNGLADTSNRIVLGASGGANRAVAKTTIEGCDFYGSSRSAAFDIVITNATNTIVRESTNQTGYNGLEKTLPVISGDLVATNTYLYKFGGPTWTIFPDGSATPSVKGETTFGVGNSAPTTITNFTGGQTGQVINIIFYDANTTIATNDDIRVNGGTYTFGLYDTISFVFNSAQWQEIARQVTP